MCVCIIVPERCIRMNLINPIGLYNNPILSKKSNSAITNNVHRNIHGDVFIKSSPSFQGNVVHKTAKLVTKNKKSFLTAIAAFFGLTTVATTTKVAPQSVVKEKPVIEVKPLKPRDYTDVELDAITSWERANNNGEQFIELRNIIKNKEKLKTGESLKREQVLLIADFLKEKPDLLKKYLRSHPECTPQELIKLNELYQRAGDYYMKVARFCPQANAEEYDVIAKNFSDLWPRERQAVSSYSRQRELIKLMQELQEKKPNDFQLKIYFSEYLFTFPAEKREQLKKLSLETTRAQDLPTTSLEELVARLQYLKTPEGKTEHLR